MALNWTSLSQHLLPGQRSMKERRWKESAPEVADDDKETVSSGHRRAAAHTNSL